MKNFWKRTISLVLAVMMAFGTMPATVLAIELETVSEELLPEEEFAENPAEEQPEEDPKPDFGTISLEPENTEPLWSEAEPLAENQWSGKSAVFVGDSITAGVGTTKLYYEYLDEALDFGSVTAMGVSGSCMSTASDYGTKNQPLITRYQNIPSADLIMIFMGTNDYGHETPLGTEEDTGDGTFYGALNVIVPALVEKHTASKIVFVTSLHRYGFGTSGILGTKFTYDNIPNGVGASLGDYVDALKTVCAENGVSVIDLFTECTLDPSDADVRTKYMPDGIHPNAAGHEVIAEIMESHIREYEPVEVDPEDLTELIHGNKFAALGDKNRASTRINYYLKAGTVITLKDPETFQWACAKTSNETSTNNLGYFPEKQWTDIATATVAEDGWVGFTFKYRDETKSFDLSRPLSDFITIEEPEETFEGKTISILGDSISTFAGYIPTADGVNLGHAAFYPNSVITAVEQTWWMQVITELEAKLGINESWSGSRVINTIDGNSGNLGKDAAMASVTRIKNLGSNGTPDYIIFFGGTNDIAFGSPIGSFDPVAAPKTADLETTKWETYAEAYTAAIMRMQYYYPDAEIIAVFPTENKYYYTAETLAKYDDVMADICEHYGVTYIDPVQNGFTTDMLADVTHPNKTGHAKIAEIVIKAINSIDFEKEKTLKGKTLSVLGASISTYAGVSNGAAADTTNSTIRNNAKYYPNNTVKDVALNDTWWNQLASDMDLRLLVNNSWSGGAILLERAGTVGAYVDRCVQLHDNTGENAGEEPDIIV
ncbi:MAG: SGNH/GDSL hydrolase family protein, partial [Oscillospiraceae bacterium]|nr:SGNH/GDSL hydrolase family protein [Oscillospiraceae bacterium]